MGPFNLKVLGKIFSANNFCQLLASSQSTNNFGRWRQPLLYALMVALMLTPLPGHAQKSEDGVPITVKVSPPLILPGGTVRIEGETVSLKSKDHVNIEIKYDGTAASAQVDPKSLKKGSLITKKISAKIDNKTNTYFITWTQDETGLGEHMVTVTGPDGKKTARTSFWVVSPVEAGERFEETFKKVCKGVKQGLSVVRDKITLLPPSPPRTEALEKLDKIQEKLIQLDPVVSNVEKISPLIRELAKKAPELVNPEIEPLIKASAEARSEFEPLKKRLEATEGKLTSCDSIDAASEALVVTSQFFNIVTGTLFAKGLGLFMDHGLPAIMNKIVPEKTPQDAQFTLNESLKVGKALREGIDGLTDLPGMFNDVAQFMTKKLFEKYCDRFAGPITVVFNAEFDEKRKTYWTYEVEIKGRLTLRLEKNQPAGQPMRITGQIEANATRHKFDADPHLIMLPPATIFELKRFPFLAKSGPDMSADPLGLGLLVHSASPGYCLIPVEGTMLGDKLVLKVLPATVDFSPLMKHQMLIIYANAALPIPLVRVTDFPIMKAQKIFANGLGKEAEFKIEVDKKCSRIKRWSGESASQEWTKEANSPQDDIRVKWHFKVDVKNPPDG